MAKDKKQNSLVFIKETGCWFWSASLRPCKNGFYGRIYVSNQGPGVKERRRDAHIFFYEAFKGEIPKNFDIDHLCRNTQCVNPDHLEAVTHHENIIRGKVAKLTWASIKDIRFKHREGISNKLLAYNYSIDSSQISRIVNNKAWKEAAV